MKTNTMIALVAGVVLLIMGISIFSVSIGWYNDAVALEEATKAQFKDNENNYDSFWKKVKEMAQVPEQYKEDFKQLLVSETQAKFGQDGSKATFQWFQDRNINFDPSLYKNVQEAIESGRDDFKRSQTELLDKQRKYSVQLKSFWGRKLAGWYDMPSSLSGPLAPQKDLDGDGKLTVLDYPIVTSAQTQQVFSSGEDNTPVNVFGK